MTSTQTIYKGTAKDWNDVRECDSAFGAGYMRGLVKRLIADKQDERKKILEKLCWSCGNVQNIAAVLPHGLVGGLVDMLEKVGLESSNPCSVLVSDCLLKVSTYSPGANEFLKDDGKYIRRVIKLYKENQTKLENRFLSLFLNLLKSPGMLGVKVLRSCNGFIDTLVSRKAFLCLSSLGEEAIEQGSILLCFKNIEEPGALECVCNLTYLRSGQLIALEQNGVQTICKYLSTVRQDENGFATLTLANIAVDQNQGKDIMIKTEGFLDLLEVVLCNPDASYGQLLGAIKLWQVLISHPAGRSFCLKSISVMQKLETLSKSSKSLLSRSACKTIELIRWEP